MVVRPGTKFLDENLIERILSEAREILCKLGITIHNKEILSLLADHGAKIDLDKSHVLFNQEMIDRALKSAPSSFQLFDVPGNQTHDFSGSNVYFTPASSSLNILDCETGEVRRPDTTDYIAYTKVVSGLQNIVARQIDVSKQPAVVTVATINGGTRKNISPDSVEMSGTIRTFDEDMRRDIHRRIEHITKTIAIANGAEAEVRIDQATAVTINDEPLTERMLPSLHRIVGKSNVQVQQRVMVAEDFSYFQQQVPGLFYFVGITPPDQEPAKAEPNHSPRFYIDEAGIILGARSLAALAVDFLKQGK